PVAESASPHSCRSPFYSARKRSTSRRATRPGCSHWQDQWSAATGGPSRSAVHTDPGYSALAPSTQIPHGSLREKSKDNGPLRFLKAEERLAMIPGRRAHESTK